MGALNFLSGVVRRHVPLGDPAAEQLSSSGGEAAPFEQRREAGRVSDWRRYGYRLIAQRASRLTRYYDQVIQWMPRNRDDPLLLSLIDATDKRVVTEADDFPDLSDDWDTRTAVLLNGNFNHHTDIQGLLASLKPKLARTSRLLVVLYNPYLSGLYRLANRLGIRRGEVPATFVTQVDLENIAKLAGYRLVQQRPMVYFPLRLGGLGDLINSVMPLLPLSKRLSLTHLVVLRPQIPQHSQDRRSLSIVIPAMNEQGNIENAITRLPDLGCDVEIIFVEGHSTDDTWAEILRVADKYSDSHKIKTFQQTGKGKVDAVRLGFSHATGDLLTILDADLTMPPERLGYFYEAYHQGLGDFINGSRLVYPMQGEAMRPLNRLGNIFFAKALSWVQDVRLGDTLCGTKLLAGHDYRRMIRWRDDFGDFDPFGDFELLFPAGELGLDIVDVPIRYVDRTYGSTNISRFRHGLILLKMTLIGLLRIKLGK